MLLIAVYACLICSIGFAADEFYVKKMQYFMLDTEQFEPISVNLGYTDAVALVFKRTPLFLEGLDIEITQSQEHLRFPNTFAYRIYTDVLPSPAVTIHNYSGTMGMQGILPNYASYNVQVPLTNKYVQTESPLHENAPSAYTPSQSILFRFYPMLSVIPDKFEHITFKTVIRPVLAGVGGLKLNVQFPEKEQKPIKVQINQEDVTDSSSVQFMKPDNYLITISSAHYRNEVRSCVVEKGKITELSIPLKSLISQLYIEPIAGVSVFLDGKKVDNVKKPLTVTPEVHVITFKIGNNEIMRQIDVKEGKKYYLMMTFDVSLEEAD
ncbi:MAG: hypothetical protein ACTTJ7_08800 [Treponema sp.]